MTRAPLLPEYKNSVFEGYAITYLHKNYWKFQHTIGDWEDACQEACWAYYYCRRKYGATVENIRHFMSLYKRCLSTWFIDWATWTSKVKEGEAYYAEHAKRQSESTCSEAELALILRDASNELKEVVNAIFETPSEVLVTLSTDLRSGIDLFFQKIVVYCGFPLQKAPELEAELRDRLTHKVQKTPPTTRKITRKSLAEVLADHQLRASVLA